MIEEHRRWAYGVGGLTPAEFGDLTPREFLRYIEVRFEQRAIRMQEDNMRFGEICATIANVFRDRTIRKEPYVPGDFLTVRQHPAVEPPRDAKTERQRHLENFYKGMKAMCRRDK